MSQPVRSSAPDSGPGNQCSASEPPRTDGVAPRIKRRRPYNILHVIYGFKTGGTERDLTETVLHMDRARFRSCVAAMSVGGYYYDRLREHGAEVLHFPLHRLYGANALRQYLRLARFIRRHIDLVQAHGLNANIFGVVAGALAGCRNVLTVRRDTGAAGRRLVSERFSRDGMAESTKSSTSNCWRDGT